MQINNISLDNLEIAEIISKEVLINTSQDMLDIMVNTGSSNIVLYEHNFSKDFFDLSTRLAGDILQKCVNYHVRLAIIGNFEKYSSTSLKAFIYENNRNRDFLFVTDLEEIKLKWK